MRVYVGALLHMVEEDNSGALLQSDTYLEYVNGQVTLIMTVEDYSMILMIHAYSPLLWRLGFMNILKVEMKNEVVSEAIDYENLIIFLWEVAADMEHNH